jgi:hypothetical protein
MLILKLHISLISQRIVIQLKSEIILLIQFIQVDKLLDLVGINLAPLQVLENKFNTNQAELDYADGIKPKVDRKQFERYTKSSEENERLRDGRKFLDALNQIEKHVKVYPANIVNGTSNLIGFDIRKGEFHINV